MMISTRTLSLCVCAAMLLPIPTASSQTNTVTQGVFRIDGGPELSLFLDPPVVLTNPDPVPSRAAEKKTASVMLDTTNIGIGPHVLEVAFDDLDGNMSTWIPSVFRIMGTKSLVGAEYYFDTDPGEGNGVPIAVPTDGAWDGPQENIQMDIVVPASLALGQHVVYVRAQNQDFLWGNPSGGAFNVVPPRTLVQVEWFIEPAPDFGLGNAVEVIAPPLDSAEELVRFTVDTATLPIGSHPEIFLRRVDSLGEWIQNPTPIILNRLPRFASINPAMPVVLNSGTLETIDLGVMTDPDGDSNVEVAVSGLPSGASFDAATDLLIWTPTSDQQGPHEFQVTRTDNFTPAGVLTTTLMLVVDGGPVATPTSLDFGVTAIGQFRTLSLNILNGSAGPISGSATASSPFLIDGDATYTNLAPGATMTVTVGFTPTSVGVQNGNVTLSGGAANVTVPVTGEGVSVAITTDPGTVDFGGIPVGDSLERDVTVTNTGSVPIDLTANLPATGSFFLMSSATFTLVPQQSTTLTLAFTPASAEIFAETVSFSGQAIGEPFTFEAQAVSLAGRGTLTAIEVATSLVDFAQVGVGGTRELFLEVTNTGTETVDVTPTTETPYTVTPSAFPLAPNLSTVFRITFMPTEIGVFDGTLTVAGASPDIVVELRGEGVAAGEGSGEGAGETGSICDLTVDALLDQLELFRQLFGAPDDLDGNQVFDEVIVFLVHDYICSSKLKFDTKAPTRVTISDNYLIAFQDNLARFRANAETADIAEGLAVLASSDSNIRDAVEAVLEENGVDVGPLSVLSCDATNCGADAALANEVFGGTGDLDEDGLSNAEEFLAVQAAGGTRNDGLSAMADPENLGGEIQSKEGTGEGSGDSSGCAAASAGNSKPAQNLLLDIMAFMIAAGALGFYGNTRTRTAAVLVLEGSKT